MEQSLDARTMAWVAIACLALLSGCSDVPPDVDLPPIDADRASHIAIDHYDTDHNGVLSRQELNAAPGILAGFSRFDADGDGEICQEEIAGRIRAWQATGQSLITYTSFVEWNRRPLHAAQVKFIPEAFLADYVAPASGTTNESGMVMLDLIDKSPLREDQQDLTGVQPGVYRVEITSDRFTLPAKYNSNTTLGIELSPDVYGRKIPTFRLTE